MNQESIVLLDFQKWLQNEKIASVSYHNDKNNLLVVRNGYWVNAFETYKQERKEKLFILSINDKIWYAFKDKSIAPNGYSEEQRIKEISITEDGILYITTADREFTQSDLGKNFFLSYEEVKEFFNSKENIDEEKK